MSWDSTVEAICGPNMTLVLYGKSGALWGAKRAYKDCTLENLSAQDVGIISGALTEGFSNQNMIEIQSNGISVDDKKFHYLRFSDGELRLKSGNVYLKAASSATAVAIGVGEEGEPLRRAVSNLAEYLQDSGM